MRFISVSLCLLFSMAMLFAGRLQAQQSGSPDSLTTLEGVTVEAYLSGQSLLETPTSVGIVDDLSLSSSGRGSLLPALNTLPGLRMEERSPGSYRLSIRGSLLRSPWGVRNVKVYLDEFPLTNAGGNTYLNLISPQQISRMEVLKGPHGSLFGANSGGVLLLNTGGNTSNRLWNAGLGGGSYGLFQEHAAFHPRWKSSHLDISQSFIRSDGYREQSAMRRHVLQLSHRWNYRPASQLKLLALYADMDYETPGGLTREQYVTDPRQARPATPAFPGAAEQQAGVGNKLLFGGISHQFQLAPHLRHVAMLFGSKNDFENPFITNYELREEGNYGLRSFLAWDGRGQLKGKALRWTWHLGLEWQRSHQTIRNYTNTGAATRGELLAADAIGSRAHFYFTRLGMEIGERLRAEAALSLNFYRNDFEKLATGSGSGDDPFGGSPPFPEEKEQRDFQPEWMPRLSLSYLLRPGLSWRASLSRGFSPPGVEEVRPSNLLVNRTLDPETAWNHESGFRFISSDQRCQADASLFYYRMNKAIVRRLDEGGNEFFVNAGGTRQLGVEALVKKVLFLESGFISRLLLDGAYTFSRFQFVDYRQGEEDYSGNTLTGVPPHQASAGLGFKLPRNIGLLLRYQFTSTIPLNDAGSIHADPYHLLRFQVDWKKKMGENRLEFYMGASNLLNERYSLGNDINAFGGRYYNAAPLRNYYGGVRFFYE